MLSGELRELRNKIDVLKIENEQLEMIKAHNAKVDLFTSKFSDKEALLEGIRDLEMFKENSFLPTEESFRLHEDGDQVFDQMLADNIGEFD